MSETRQVRAAETAFETREADGQMIIEGYFSVFGTDYNIAPGMTETVAQGAFDRTLGTQDVRALTNHDTRLVLGRQSAGTLTLKEDTHGLWGSILVNPNDQDAVNTYERIRRGDVNQCSFGFDIVKEDAEYLPDGSVRWTIRDVELYEVSVCTFPAYAETNVQARAAERETMDKRRREAWKAKMLERVRDHGDQSDHGEA